MCTIYHENEAAYDNTEPRATCSSATCFNALPALLFFCIRSSQLIQPTTPVRGLFTSLHYKCALQHPDEPTNLRTYAKADVTCKPHIRTHEASERRRMCMLGAAA